MSVTYSCCCLASGSTPRACDQLQELSSCLAQKLSWPRLSDTLWVIFISLESFIAVLLRSCAIICSVSQTVTLFHLFAQPCSAVNKSMHSFAYTRCLMFFACRWEDSFTRCLTKWLQAVAHAALLRKLHAITTSITSTDTTTNNHHSHADTLRARAEVNRGDGSVSLDRGCTGTASSQPSSASAPISFSSCAQLNQHSNTSSNERQFIHTCTAIIRQQRCTHLRIEQLAHNWPITMSQWLLYSS